jgi:hypothetical protein
LVGGGGSGLASWLERCWTLSLKRMGMGFRPRFNWLVERER